MNESSNDLLDELCETFPSVSEQNVEKDKVFPNASSTIKALETLQLLVKDIENIKDPAEASAARKECYAFYEKIIDQMEPIDSLRIRENSSLFRSKLSLKEKMDFKIFSITLICVCITLGLLLFSLILTFSINKEFGVVVLQRLQEFGSVVNDWILPVLVGIVAWLTFVANRNTISSEKHC